jgi:hypothetical protein
MSIGRDRKIERFAGHGPKGRQLTDKIHDASTQERLSTGNPNFRDAKRHQDPRHP